MVYVLAKCLVSIAITKMELSYCSLCCKLPTQAWMVLTWKICRPIQLKAWHFLGLTTPWCPKCLWYHGQYFTFDCPWNRWNGLWPKQPRVHATTAWALAPLSDWLPCWTSNRCLIWLKAAVTISIIDSRNTIFRAEQRPPFFMVKLWLKLRLSLRKCVNWSKFWHSIIMLIMWWISRPF